MEEMETSFARYRAARLQVERLQEASAASERAAELARMRFREGVTDFLQVLDAERTELEAQDRLAHGRIDAATAYAALYKAAGGKKGGGSLPSLPDALVSAKYHPLTSMRSNHFSFG